MNIYFTCHFIRTVRSAIIAGKACTVKIFLSAVNVPYSPAIEMLKRKKMDTFTFQIGSDMKYVHIRPAARMPLYNP